MTSAPQSVVLSVRVAPDLARDIHDLARARDTTCAALLREAFTLLRKRHKPVMRLRAMRDDLAGYTALMDALWDEVPPRDVTEAHFQASRLARTIDAEGENPRREMRALRNALGTLMGLLAGPVAAALPRWRRRHGDSRGRGDEARRLAPLIAFCEARYQSDP